MNISTQWYLSAYFTVGHKFQDPINLIILFNNKIDLADKVTRKSCKTLKETQKLDRLTYNDLAAKVRNFFLFFFFRPSAWLGDKVIGGFALVKGKARFHNGVFTVNASVTRLHHPIKPILETLSRYDDSFNKDVIIFHVRFSVSIRFLFTFDNVQ